MSKFRTLKFNVNALIQGETCLTCIGRVFGDVRIGFNVFSKKVLMSNDSKQAELIAMCEDLYTITSCNL